jgi:hypothetical protein
MLSLKPLNNSIFNQEVSNRDTILSLQKNWLWLIVLVIYTTTLVVIYIHLNNEYRNRKEEILSEYHKIIFNHSFNKLSDLLRQLPADSTNTGSSISIDRSDIQSCYKQQCVKNNLFEFASIFSKYIPEFISYKIEVNKQLLHRNNKVDNYELEKTDYINNHNQLSISLSASSKYWDSIRHQTFRPFFVTFISLTLVSVLFVISIGLIEKRMKKLYKSYYEAQQKNFEETYKTELTLKEDKLMKKIWNLEYSITKEAEFNYLFSREANKLAMIIQEIENTGCNHKNKFLPYTIPLYRKTNELENIDTTELSEIFTSRFSEIKDNILLNIQSFKPHIKFTSKAALYQIIYSVISYITLILSEQYSDKHEIRLIIKSNNKVVQLLFEYDGAPITGEQDLFKMANIFFKKHANPFLLNINQVFSILRNNGFDCNVKYNRCNIIEILQKEQTVCDQTDDNIIQLSKFMKEKQ